MKKQSSIIKGMIIAIMLTVMLALMGWMNPGIKAEENQPKAITNFAESNATGNEVQKTKNIEIILDASGSMKAMMSNGKTKMAVSRKAIEKLLDGLNDYPIQLAVRAYGHQSAVEEHNCQDTELLFPLGAIDKSTAMEKINSISPQGYTPIGYSLQKAGEDFPVPQEGVSNVIILVSDGEETCDGNPCQVAKNLKTSNIETTIHTIGFGVDNVAREQLQCIADATGGKYFDAENADDLTEVLLEAVNNELKYGRFTVRTYGINGNPISASVFFRNQKTGKIVRNALNEIDGNSSGKDGIYSYLYEPGEYKLDIGNLSIRENIILTAGEENMLEIYLSTIELTTKSKMVIFKIKTADGSNVDGQMLKAGKIWTKELPEGEYKIKKEMVDSKMVDDEYQFFTIKRGEKTQIEL